MENVEIIRQNRKTLVISVDRSAKVVVKAPQGMSDFSINRFILNKKNWIEKNVKTMQEHICHLQTYNTEDNAYIWGKEINLDLYAGKKLTKTEKCRLKKKLYSKAFEELLQFAYEMQLRYDFQCKEVKLVNSVKVWGSFSSENVMKLNRKLVTLKANYIFYVLIHEFCHQKQMNHSKKFWLEVEKYCPDYKSLRNDMKNFSHILNREMKFW